MGVGDGWHIRNALTVPEFSVMYMVRDNILQSYDTFVVVDWL